MSMRQIYRKIARENGVTVAEVKQAMQAVIDDAYTNPPQNGANPIYQNSVPRKGEIPTTEEFIRYAKNEITKRKN